MRLQRESAHGSAADQQADDRPTCLCFFTLLMPAASEMPDYAAAAIDPATTPATVRSSACLPEQTGPSTLHAANRPINASRKVIRRARTALSSMLVPSAGGVGKW